MIPEYEEIALAGGRMTIQLRHHGGRDGVTGSCHQLLVDGGKSLLVIAACSRGRMVVAAIRLVHGEAAARLALRQALGSALGAKLQDWTID